MGMISGTPSRASLRQVIFDDAAAYRPESSIRSEEEKIKLMDRHLMTVSVARTYFVHVGCTE